MDAPESTCWTMIRAAARGEARAADAFAAAYGTAIRAYLLARWGRTPMSQEIDDAAQEVFVECFREGGALGKVDSQRGGGFRAFLYGVARNVALRCEARRARNRENQAPTTFGDGHSVDEARLSAVFDAAWARGIMRQAAARMAELAASRGEEAQRRVELLRLRFYDDLPIREIARRWQLEAEHVHRQYARARAEFRAALLAVIAENGAPGCAAAEAECAELLAILAD